ncbi:MAG: hypothetical protein ACEQSB_02715 [Undibacterium sp.]
MAKRNHPDYYYQIRDAVIALMGPAFEQAEFRRHFPKAAAPYKVIPFSDGYLAHRRIIEGLVKAKMAQVSAALPKEQLRLHV